MSVEAAEHLPEQAAAPLVSALVTAAPVVLFAASIPHCSGEHHVNCQWPSYWANLFAHHGYACVDSLRLKVWNDNRVDWWYRQDLMLYVDHPSRLIDPHVTTAPLPLVHPLMVDEIVAWGVRENARYWELFKQHNPV